MADASDLTELERLRQENAFLASQVQRLVKTESQLYEVQGKLDQQINLYRKLYELGKHLNKLSDTAKILNLAIQFVLYELLLERCLFLMQDDLTQLFRVSAYDGYYDERQADAIEQLELDADTDVLRSLLQQSDLILCEQNCQNPQLLSFREQIGIDEYVVIPLYNVNKTLNGLLIAGNTFERRAYHAPIIPGSEQLLGLGNLASRLNAVLQNLESYRALTTERNQLEKKVTQLVKTELQLYNTQEQLDHQLHIYRSLYEFSQAIFDQKTFTTAFPLVTEFVLYQLNYQRCLLLLKADNPYELKIQAFDGFYEDNIYAQIQTLSLPTDHPALQPLALESEYLICDGNCQDVSLTSLRPVFHLDEYFIFSLGHDRQQPVGILVIGNSAEMASYQSQVSKVNVVTMGLESLASQTTAVINSISNHIALEQSRQTLESSNNTLAQTLAELHQTQSQLIQSEKMSSLGQLVAGVAHEINNPVSFIHGNLEPAQNYASDLLQLIACYKHHYPNPSAAIQRLSEDIDLDFLEEDFPKVLQSMHIGTERIREIILSLRNFSRIDEAAVKYVDIHEGLDSTLTILGSQLKGKNKEQLIKVVKSYGALPPVECFAGPLNQVFMNILSNAIDALRDEEALAARSLAGKHSQITIQTSAEDTHIIISIEDNGPGMTKDVRNRIFDVFFTTKPVGKGTGMGMSISYQIITEKHQGQLLCESEPEQGTQFRIILPIHQTVWSNCKETTTQNLKSIAS